MLPEDNPNTDQPSLPIRLTDPNDPAWMLAQSQQQLKAYILSLLNTSDAADDILQETNAYILNNFDKFEPGTNFKAWSVQVAYYRVKAHIRDRQRRGHVELSDELIEHISNAASNYFVSKDERLTYLHQCIEKLAAKERLLLRLQYIEGESLTKLAERTNQSPNTLHKALSRIRQTLRICIESQQSQELS